jgi:leucyl aminopeptidase (aminopeptidase T)
MVVRNSLRVTNSDIVVINTWDWTSGFASALALESFKRGADVLMTLYTDDFFFGHLAILSENDLRQTSRHCLELADYATVEIFVGGPLDHSRFQDLPTSKSAANAQGEQVHWRKNRERRIRTAILDFSAAHPRVAKAYGFDYSRWKAATSSAVMVDYGGMSKFGMELASRLQDGRRVHIRQGEDTDLEFEISGRTPRVSDGLIDENDVRRGDVFTSLPSGRVEIAPVEASAKGHVKFDLPWLRSGKAVRGVEWTFEDGHIVALDADLNLKLLRERWEVATGDRDKIGILMLGINPGAKFGFDINSLVKGAVSIGIGANKHLGGENDTDFSLTCTLSRATLEIDGTPIVVNGRCVAAKPTEKPR